MKRSGKRITCCSWRSILPHCFSDSPVTAGLPAQSAERSRRRRTAGPLGTAARQRSYPMGEYCWSTDRARRSTIQRRAYLQLPQVRGHIPALGKARRCCLTAGSRLLAAERSTRPTFDSSVGNFRIHPRAPLRWLRICISPRPCPSAVLLNNGKVLIAGGSQFLEPSARQAQRFTIRLQTRSPWRDPCLVSFTGSEPKQLGQGMVPNRAIASGWKSRDPLDGQRRGRRQ